MTTSQTFKPVYHPSDTLESQKDTIVNHISDAPFDSVFLTEVSPSAAGIKSDPVSNPNPVEIPTAKSLDEIATNIIVKKTQIVQNFIEIGKLLIEAKEQTDKGYGKWSPWLCTVGIQPRMAQIYMQVAQAYPNAKSISHLGITKAHALLALPEEKRQTFIKTQDVDKMSVRDLKTAIKCETESHVPTNNPSHQIERNLDCTENEIATENLDKFAQHLSSAQEQIDFISDFLLDKSNEAGDSVLQTTIRDAYGDLLRNLFCNIQKCITIIKLDEE